MDVREKILRILSDMAPEVDFQKIDPDQPLRDQVDIDSIDFLSFVTKIHEQIGVEIPESDYGRLVTLNQIVSYLIEKIQA